MSGECKSSEIRDLSLMRIWVGDPASHLMAYPTFQLRQRRDK